MSYGRPAGPENISTGTVRPAAARCDFVPDPGAERANPGRLVGRVQLLQESIDLPRKQEGQVEALVASRVSAILLEQEDAEHFPVVMPDLRDTQSGVDGQAVQEAVRDLDLDRQVGGRVDRQVDLPLAADPGLVPNPVALV